MKEKLELLWWLLRTKRLWAWWRSGLPLTARLYVFDSQYDYTVWGFSKGL